MLEAARQAPSAQAALALCEQAVRLAPDTPRVHFEHGMALQACGRAAEAADAFVRVIRIAPGVAAVWANLGVVLIEIGQVDAALEALEMAINIDPQLAAAHANRAIALRELGRFEDALQASDQALTLAPDDPAALCNRSVCELLTGDLEQGFRDHENRWRLEPGLSQRRAFAAPQWFGQEDIAGKTLLIHAEQGFGDAIQFCRYAPMLAARGAHVVLEAPRPLLPVLRSLEGVETLVAAGDPLPRFDLHCPLMSLPLALGTRLETIPAESPYLVAPAERVARWSAELGPPAAPRVGLVWFGKPTHLNDRNRSIPLARFLGALPGGLELFSLQDRARPEDAAALAARPDICRFDGRLGDFGDTAALASLMDMVIAVDTSVAHLAAALGRPTWILLPFSPDWRWLLGRDDSPWYPSVRLFRQPARGDWDAALAEVRTALDAKALAWPSRSP